MSIKHRPVVRTLPDGRKSYDKIESDDHFYFKKMGTITINAEVLEKVDIVRIKIPHLGVAIGATKTEIKEYKTVKTFHGETKFHYPVEKWRVLGEGPKDWYKDLKKL